MSQTTVTGITGGKAEKVLAAHTIHGGVGNIGKQYNAENISNTVVKECQGVALVGDIKGNQVTIKNTMPWGK